MNPDERIERAVNRQLSPADWEAFQKDVINDDGLRASYVESAMLHGQLAAIRDSLPSILTTEKVAESRVTNRLPWGIAAVLALGLLVLFTLHNQKPEIVATISESTNARWAGSELPTNEGAELSAGLLELAEGMATLRFESGATITLEAPATVEVLSKMKCRLLAGSVVADVPDSAHGFTIDTREMEVVDLGTRFGLTTSEFGHSHVYVFEGEVEVHRSDSPDTEIPKKLLTGNSLHIGNTTAPSGDQEIDRLAAPNATGDGWIPLPVFVGRGKDGYIRHDNSTRTKSDEPLLMVKHTTLAKGNERRAILTFDLAGIDLSNIADSKLTLETATSGLGFSAMVPDSRFAIYGILSNRLDAWDEKSLTWESQPEFATPELPSETFTRLGEFEIKRGATPATIEIQTRQLLDFLKSDTNDLLSFILVRETDELDQQGLVHAFASKENPHSRPPTLWIKNSFSTTR